MTSTDQRVERYLHDRSATLDLPYPGVDAITRRARTRHRRRTAAGGGVVAALLVGGAAVALRSPTPGEEVGSVGAAVVDSPLEWSVVPVRTGLGYGSRTLSDDGAVYSLSTAPGTEGQGDGPEPLRLYRSDDGTDWEDVGLPDGLSATGIGVADGSVYAVGTAAAGGAVGVELAVSDDGGAAWATQPLPLDVAALGEGFPGRVRPVDAEVAVHDGTTVVAVTVVGTVDPAQVLPDEPDPDLWVATDAGMTRPSGCGAITPPTTTAPAEPETSAPETITPPSTDPSATNPPSTTAPADPSSPPGDAGASPGSTEPCAEGETGEVEVRTWEELGVSPEHVALVQGRTHLFARGSGDGADGTLDPVTVVDDLVGFADPGSGRLLAADDGWWIVADRVSRVDEGGMDLSTEVRALHSADGRTWTPRTIAADEASLSAGVVGGRPVVVGVVQRPGTPTSIRVHRIEPGGSVTTVDVGDLLDLPDPGILASGVGPLGVAVVVSDVAAEGAPAQVLTSPDGLAWSAQPLPEAEPGTQDLVSGITVTPDAVKVRINVRDADDPVGAEPADQRLFVGTHAG